MLYMTPGERMAAYRESHPQPLTKREKKLEKVAMRVRKMKEARLAHYLYIEKLRTIDNETLDAIGKKVGVSRQRVDAILAIIENRPYGRKKTDLGRTNKSGKKVI